MSQAFRPVQAHAYSPEGDQHLVALSDRDGGVMLLDLRSADSAAFIAAAIQNELKNSQT